MLGGSAFSLSLRPSSWSVASVVLVPVGDAVVGGA
jgi:hypothetical protein